ncbi:M1 family metallopeptidase [Acidimicrobiia bacterium EGI L10123]|uniref:M1 family metallopeptidase n=1 Tax=Salinilacustrithrix flava TaxID=2957203 RepID=UPI003D7C1AAC|nr:M1 family metallopeptidase [Acidimicrobiia bacterium EGI L10123]
MPSDDATAPPPATGDRAGRLPASVRPERYDLRLAPDLATSTFRGAASVTLDVGSPTAELVCNAAELDVSEAWVDLDGRRIDGEIHLDADLEQLRVALPETLPGGTATLHLTFSGVLNDRLRGFYRSTYTADGGGDRAIAVTQFEPTDARRAFPCWDEPEFKAVFGVTLDVAEDLLAISNGPELAREDLGDGRVRIRFADTMPMSTYLVAFVVGPMETTGPVDVDGVPLRIVHRPGQGELAEFALEVGAHALRFFADYYGIAYPGDKVDMVAVPDFAFGAMENLGCVVYRETLLLVDPESATQAELLAVVDVIAHELAHMWFGDLVTMRWWNGIWLNEAFATFMEAKCAAAFRPAWERWMHFGRERSGAFDVDALATTRPIEYPVITPADAEGMFDTLTYQKGSAVVRMLEQYLGEDAFRDGIRRYLQAHQFGNTETGDLWDALEAVTGEPVRAMMDSWIFQGGFPLVTASLDDAGLTLTQQPFRYTEPADAGDGEDPRWHVPVVVRSAGGTERIVLDGPRASLTLPATPTAGAPVVVNAGGHAFYRVSYDAELQAAVLDGLGDLAPLERYAVLDDAHGLTLRGDRRAGDLAATVQRIADVGETDLSVWQLAASSIEVVDRAASEDERPAVSAWVRRLLAPLAARLGDDVDPTDDDRTRALRGLVLGLRGVHGDPDALARATAVFEQQLHRPTEVDAELGAGALKAAAVTADADRFDAMLDRFRHGATPQEQVRYLYAAATVADGDLFSRYLALLETDEVRSQNLAFAYRAALRNPAHDRHAWTAVRDGWERIRARLPFNANHRLVEGITSVTDPALADEIEEFLATHPVPEATTLIAQHVERMRVQVAVHQREAGQVASSLPGG